MTTLDFFLLLHITMWRRRYEAERTHCPEYIDLGGES